MNKYLADSKLRRDVKRYDCEDYEGTGAEVVCAATTASLAASIYHWGVAIWNHKNWIITAQDIDRGNYGLDAFFSPSFINCASPHLPRVRNLRITKSSGNFAAQWNFEAGCVVGINDIKFVFTSRSRARTNQQLLDSRLLTNLCVSTNNQITCSHTFHSASPPWGVNSISVEVIPKEKRYGVPNFLSRTNSRSGFTRRGFMTAIIAPFLVFAPFFALAILLALAVLGVLFMPIAAVSSALVARQKGTNPYALAARGSLYSLLLFAPSVYFILRLFNKDVSPAFLVCGYSLLYAVWLLGGPGLFMVINLVSENPSWISSALVLFTLATTAGPVLALLKPNIENSSTDYIHIRYLVPFIAAYVNLLLVFLFISDPAPLQEWLEA